MSDPRVLAALGDADPRVLPPAEAPVTPEQRDIEASKGDTSFTKGARQGFNQLAAGTNALAGTFGDAMGLTDFAAERFAEADQYTKFADAVAPETRDYRQVKDLNSLADYVVGQLGNASAQFAPALVGGVGGAALKGGLRGAALGLGAGSFVPNAGEQAQNIHEGPGTPGGKLANALGVGAVNAALDVVPEIGVAKQLLKPTAKGAAKQFLKTTGLEAGTEGLQAEVGHKGQDILDPNRDTSGDAADTINSALAGAIGGAGLAGAGHVASVAPGHIADGMAALRKKFAPKDLVDTEDVSHIASNPDLSDPDAILKAIDEHDANGEKSLRDVYEHGKEKFAEKFGSIDDLISRGGEKLDEFKTAAKDYLNEAKHKPAVQAAMKQARDAGDFMKGFVDGATGKKSLQRTATDLAIHDAVMKMIPERTKQNLTPSERIELSGMVKHAALHAAGARTEVEGPGAPARGLNEGFPTSQERESDRTTQPVRLPTGMLSLLGPDATKIIQTAQEVLRSGGIPFKGDAVKAVGEATGRVRARKTALESIIHDNLKDEYLDNPEDRKTVTEGFIRMLNHADSDKGYQDFWHRAVMDPKAEGQRMDPHAQNIMEAAGLMFNDRPKAMREIEAHLQNEGFAKEFHLTNEELAQFDDEGERVPRDDTAYNDPRLRAYDTIEQARQAYRALEEDYSPKHVQIRHEQEMKYDPDSGVDQPTGRIILSAHDRASSDTMSGEPPHKGNDFNGTGQWKRIIDKRHKAGFENGVITVQMKNGAKIGVNLMGLTKEATRTLDSKGDSKSYPRRAVLHGLSMLLADSNVENIGGKTKEQVGEGQWDIPDNTVVGKIHGKVYSWGEIKEMGKLTSEQLSLRQMMERPIEAAQQASSLDEIENEHLPFAQKRLKRLIANMNDAPGQPKEGRTNGKTDRSKDFKGGKLYFAAKRRVEAQERVVAAIYDEMDRREREGDYPLLEMGSADTDSVEEVKDDKRASAFDVNPATKKPIAEKDVLRQHRAGVTTMRDQDPSSVRYVQEETGSNLGDGRDAPRGSGYQPHEVGQRPEDRAPGPVKVTKPGEEAKSSDEPSFREPTKLAKGPAIDVPFKHSAETVRDVLEALDVAPRENETEGKFLARTRDSFKELLSSADTFPVANETIKMWEDVLLSVPADALREAFGTDRAVAGVRKIVADAKKELAAAAANMNHAMKAQVMPLADEQSMRSAEEIDKALTAMYANKELYGQSGISGVTDPKTLKKLTELRRAFAKLDVPKSNDALNMYNKVAQRFKTLKLGAEASGKKFSEIPASATQRLTEQQKADVREYVEKVLGKDRTGVFFKNMEAAGTFANIDGAEVLQIAHLALDPMGAARHEAAHALMSRLLKSDKRTAQQLLAAAGSANVVSRLRVLLKDHPEALKQLSDPEERLAYAYQFWAAGQLDLGPKTKGVMEQVRKFFRTVASLWSETFNDARNVDRAQEVFDLFDRGELSDRNTVAEVLRDKAPRTPFAKATDVLGPLWRGVEKVLYTSDGFVRAMNIPAFNEVADKFHAPLGREGAKPGFNQAKHPMRNVFHTAVSRAIGGASEAVQREALEHLQGGTPAKSAEARAVVERVRPLLADIFNYMKDKGVKAVVWNGKEYEEHELGEVRDYFPRYYDRQAIVENRPAFVAMLRKNGLTEREAGDLADKLLKSSPADPAENDEQVGLTYYAPNTQARKLNVPAEDLAPFLRKDLYGTLNSYVNYTVRRAEYASRFGNQGQKIRKAITRAIEDEGANEDQVREFNKAVQAWEGSLGHDIKPGLKGVFGALTTYQNIRLLPLALFSSLVDPMGIMVRGGTAAESFGAFVRGVRGLVGESKDDAHRLALLAGVVSDSLDDHMLADAYGSQYMSDALRHINDKFFRLNGMESWNRQMRIAATPAAMSFIVRHAQKPNEHSARYLSELGISADDVKVRDGQLDISSQKMKDAVNLWVDGAILRPNAAVRPVWMSDPHWMLVSHLKQYTYSFQKTIIARVAHEFEHGNYTPAVALASYVPMIIAADVLRAMLTPGSGDDDVLKKLTLAGVVGRGIQRAGLVGPGQYALDAWGDMGHDTIPLASFGGPTFQQLVELGGAAAKPGGDLGHQALRALPGYVLVR